MKKHTIITLLSLFFIQSYIHTQIDTTLQNNINNLIKAKDTLQLLKTKKNRDEQQKKIKKIIDDICNIACNKMNYQIENIIDILKANAQNIDPFIQKGKCLEKLYTDLFYEQKNHLGNEDIYITILSQIKTPSIALLAAMRYAINNNTPELILELDILHEKNNDQKIQKDILGYINDAVLNIWDTDKIGVYQLYKQVSNKKTKKTISNILDTKDKNCSLLLNAIKNDTSNFTDNIKKLDQTHQKIVIQELIENKNTFNSFTKNLEYFKLIKLLNMQSSTKRITTIQSHINKSNNQMIEQIPYKVRIGFGIITSMLLSTIQTIKECYNKRSIKAALKPKKFIKHASFALCAGACGYFLPLLLDKERPLITIKNNNNKHYIKDNPMEIAKKLGSHLGIPVISACAPHLVNTIYSKYKTKKLHQ